MFIAEIPDDARVNIEQNRYKADKIILTEIIEYKNMPDKFWIDILPFDHNALRMIREQTEELCLIVLEQNVDAFHFMKDEFKESKRFESYKHILQNQEISDEICRNMVNDFHRSGNRIKYMKHFYQKM